MSLENRRKVYHNCQLSFQKGYISKPVFHLLTVYKALRRGLELTKGCGIDHIPRTITQIKNMNDLGLFLFQPCAMLELNLGGLSLRLDGLHFPVRP